MRKDAPLTVDVPPRDHDGPSWIKVGIIAAVGFALGIAWPRLVGVKLGPTAPSESSSAAASASASSRAAARTADAPPASVSAKAPLQPAASAAAAPPVVTVPRGAVSSCKTEDGETKKGKECGSVAPLDAIVQPRLRKLAQCSAADGQTGKLSFVVNADFGSGRLGWDVGKSSTVGNVEGITTCLKTFFHGTAVTGLAHENPRITVVYHATFAAGEARAKPDRAEPKAEPSEAKSRDDKPAPEPGAGSEATIGWEVALVRDVPKTGQVVARLSRGAKVKLSASKDGWYAVRYGDGFASDGWVYGGALGK